MGYYSRASGKLQLDPPITYKELVDAGYDVDNPPYGHNELPLKDGWQELYFYLRRDVRVKDEGRLEVITTSEVLPTDESQKMYGIYDSVKRLVSDFGGTHRITGAITIYGEEEGDISRIRIVDNEVIDERPKLLWPDGTESNL